MLHTQVYIWMYNMPWENLSFEIKISFHVTFDFKLVQYFNPQCNVTVIHQVLYTSVTYLKLYIVGQCKYSTP